MDKYATKRGIYQGATRAEVESAYGKSNHAFNADGYDIVMEYPFTSEDKRPCLLRFAIKNGIVDYISSRIWIDEEDRQKAHSPNAAAEVFVGFHKDITGRNFSSAFGAFTRERQSRYQNSWQKFSDGYGTTILSEVTNLNVISSNDNEVVFSYRLLARDREMGGVVRRVFDGKVLMVFENNAWKIAETESKKVSESRE